MDAWIESMDRKLNTVHIARSIHEEAFHKAIERGEVSANATVHQAQFEKIKEDLEKQKSTAAIASTTHS